MRTRDEPLHFADALEYLLSESADTTSKRVAAIARNARDAARGGVATF